MSEVPGLSSLPWGETKNSDCRVQDPVIGTSNKTNRKAAFLMSVKLSENRPKGKNDDEPIRFGPPWRSRGRAASAVVDLRRLSA